MRWQTPRFSRDAVDNAGAVLASPDSAPDDRESGLEILDNWRASHAFPLNTIQMGLRRHAKSAKEPALIAQRLKRTPAIETKLRLRPWIHLSKMQDIGGCRAVVRSVSDVYRIHGAFERSRAPHRLVRPTDYIAEPRESGYRSLHLIYAFESERSSPYTGLQVEVQIRTRLQHAWATTVEIVDFLLHQSLKVGLGEDQWREFFRLASAAFALVEGTTGVPNVSLSMEALRSELQRRASALRVHDILMNFGKALNQIRDMRSKGVQYYLLSLDTADKRLSVRGFQRRDIRRATDAYLQAERQLSLLPSPGTDTVLVSASSLDALRRSYPNYFLDSRVFLERLDSIIHSKKGRPNASVQRTRSARR